MSEEQIEPRWLTYEGAERYSGLNKRTLQNYVKDGHVRSSNVKQPGATRGRRLIDRQSLDEFIEGGISEPPTDLAMNRKKRASAPLA